MNKKPKKLRDYQKEAVENSLKYFKKFSRGKLIMAPGTGKTFTSLKIAEALMTKSGKNNFNVLYLVPSIQLLSQTLFNWNSDKSDDISIVSFSVVSDKKATKKKNGKDDLSAKDVGFPATTNVAELMSNYESIQQDSRKTMTVIFSTYQSATSSVKKAYDMSTSFITLTQRKSDRKQDPVESNSQSVYHDKTSN